MKKLLLLFAIVQVFVSCNAQSDETYWKSEEVTKVDGKPFWGITSGYMDMIAEMRIHLSKNNDYLIFHYPYEKKIKIADLKSLTDCRLKSTGELLDSIYEVSIEDDKLQIKFHYLGTADKENRFVLNLIKIDKNKYLEETEKLKSEKTKLQSMIKPIDATTLDLSVAKPAYFNSGINMSVLNPIELAKDLCDIDGLGTSVSKNVSFQISDKGSYQFNYYSIKNSDEIGTAVAEIGGMKFNSLAFITDASGKENKAFVLTQKELDKKSTLSLYNIINTKMKGAEIDEFGLPALNSPILKTFSIIWKSETQIIKLLIEPSTALKNDKVTLPDVGYERHSAKDITKVFNHYLNLTEKAKVRIIVVSTEFDALLNADGFSGNSLGILRPTIDD